MKKLYSLIALASASLLIASAVPSYFSSGAAYYTQEFDWDSKTTVIEWSNRIGIKGNEVFLGRPRVRANGEIVLCECKKEAVSISFKEGKMTALCPEHTPFKHPVNQQKYPTMEKIDNKQK